MNASPFLLATLAFAASAAAQAPPIVCTPNPIACEPAPRRFDPAFQRFLVERKLELQPSYWATVYFYLPPLEQRELEELQIRYIAELLAREEAKQRAADERGAARP